MNLNSWVLLALTLIMSACHVKANKSTESDKGRLAYEFSENGCNTGKREFSGTRASAFTQMCAALQNDGLNCYCASYSRRTYFKDIGCSGDYVSSAGQMNSDCGTIKRGSSSTNKPSSPSNSSQFEKASLPTDGSPCPSSLATELNWLNNLSGFNYFSVRVRCPKIQELGAFRCTVDGKLWTNGDAAQACLQHMN